MRKIKIGVYANNCGHQITNEVKANPDINAEIIASCKCENAEDIPGITLYDTLEDMLRDERIELVSLCSPRRSDQAADAIACMRAGKHVLAEKPCAMTESELDEIIRVSDETGAQFHEMAGISFLQPFDALRELAATGVLGDIVQVYTQKSYPLNLHIRPQDEDVDGGLIRQVGIYNVRFIEHITGIKVKDIFAAETKLGNPSADGDLHTAVSFMMTLENGGVASACANYMNQPQGFGKYGNECVRIFGTKGYAELMDGCRKSRVVTDNEYRGELDTSKKCKTYLERYVDSLLGLDKMPLTAEDELHPTRMVIRAADRVIKNS